MDIRHEAPAKELEWSVRAPLLIETPAGEIVKISHWSLSHLQWPESSDRVPETGTLSVPFHGVDIRFPVRLSKPNAANQVKLQGLSGRQRETLALFYRSLLSGRMASSDELITSLDTPLDLVPMEQTEAEKASQVTGLIPRGIRVVVSVVTWVLLAALVVGVIGNNIFTSLNRIDIQHGRVIAPLLDVPDRSTGVVAQIHASVGQPVQAGDLLLRMRDPALEARLQTAEIALARAAEQLHRLEQEVQALRQLKQDGPRLARAAQLYSKYIKGAGFYDLRRHWISLRQRNAAIAQDIDPVRVVAQVMDRDIQTQRAQLATLRVERDAISELISANHIYAPQTGTLRSLSALEGQAFVSEMAQFEAKADRVTMGWVSERFAETVYINMPARIGYNDNGQRVSLAGIVQDVQAGHHPERPGEFGIIVTVAPVREPGQSFAALRMGAPVNLEAERQLWQRFQRWVMTIRGGHD